LEFRRVLFRSTSINQVQKEEVTYDTTSQTVEVEYTKLPDKETAVASNKQQVTLPTPKKQAKVQSKFVTTELPQTGEKRNSGLIATGLASIVASLGLTGIMKRKKRKNKN